MPVAPTDFEPSPDYCPAYGSDNTSVGLGSYAQPPAALWQELDAHPTGAVTNGPGKDAQWASSGGSVTNLVWRADDGRTWVLGYMGSDATTAKAKERMLAAAREVDSYLVPGASKANPTLTLGAKQDIVPGISAPGLGAVRPSRVELSTHHTQIIDNITWRSWGGQAAEGIGRAENAEHAPDGILAGAPMEKAYVVATFGKCNGTPMYNKLTWSFVSFEDAHNKASNEWRNLCNINQVDY